MLDGWEDTKEKSLEKSRAEEENGTAKRRERLFSSVGGLPSHLWLSVDLGATSCDLLENGMDRDKGKRYHRQDREQQGSAQ